MGKPIRPAYIIFCTKKRKRGSIVNIYIAYSLAQKIISSNNIFKNSLFGAIKVTKPNNTTDPEKCVYSGYGISVDHTGQFTHSDGTQARNVIIFGLDSSNSIHATNKTPSILVLGHGLIHKINNMAIYAEKMYLPNFSVENKAFCLSIHYNGGDSYLFVNGKEVTKFKAKDSEIKANQLTLGSISTSGNLSSSDIKDSKHYGNVYDFSVDYSATTNDEILDIHNYLMKKNIV